MMIFQYSQCISFTVIVYPNSVTTRIWIMSANINGRVFILWRRAHDSPRIYTKTCWILVIILIYIEMIYRSSGHIHRQTRILKCIEIQWSYRWSQPAVAAILPSGRIEAPAMPGRSNVISFLITQVPYSEAKKHEMCKWIGKGITDERHAHRSFLRKKKG